MTITRNRGIKYSEYIIETIGSYFADNNDIYASVETFYNCREQGYVLRVHDNNDYNKSLCIWIYAQRNSDDPAISWDYIVIPKEEANMFSEETYRERTEYFNNVNEASMKAINIIKDYFK